MDQTTFFLGALLGFFAGMLVFALMFMSRHEEEDARVAALEYTIDVCSQIVSQVDADGKSITIAPVERLRVYRDMVVKLKKTLRQYSTNG